MANLRVSGLDIGTNTLTVDKNGTLLVNGAEVSGGGGISYVWPTETERTAHAGMSKGEQGIQQDTNIVYKYDGTKWVEYYKTGSKYPEQTGNAGKFLMTTGENVEWSDVDLTNYYTKEDTDGLLDTKQDTLVSGTSIKTINGQSVLGNGDLDLEGLSTLSSSKLNVEVLTERRHPVSGKPLYTKTINFGALPNNTTKHVNHNTSNVEDINIVFDRSYILDNSNPTIRYPVIYPHPTAMTLRWISGSTITTIFITTGSNSAIFNAIITVEYTKTTDTAESPVRLLGGGGVPTGSIIYHTSNIPPKGYLKANGATLLREEFPDLFAVIGTTYGSDTELDFNLPDLRGEFIRGYDDGRGVDTSREFGSNQTDTIQNITGKINAAPIGTSSGIWASVWAEGGAFASSYKAHSTRPRIPFTNYSDTPYMHIEFDASRIVRTSTETRPRNIALLPCIKY